MIRSTTMHNHPPFHPHPTHVQITSHSDGKGGGARHARQLMPRDAQGRKVCYYYNFRGCTNGPGCAFAHIEVRACARAYARSCARPSAADSVC